MQRTVVMAQPMDFSGQRPVRVSRSVQSTNAFLFLAVVWWPHFLVPVPVTVTVLAAVSLLALLNRPLQFPTVGWPVLIFVAYSIAAIAWYFVIGEDSRYGFSQFNHLLQFALYLVAFSKIVQGFDWIRLVSSGRFIAGTCALWVIYSAMSGSTGIRDSDLSLPLVMLFIGLFLRAEAKGRPGVFLVVLPLGVLSLLLTQRLSMFLVVSAMFAIYLVRPARWVTGALVAAIVLGPLIVYLGIDHSTVRWLYELDHNVGIRSEFIRGGAWLLDQSGLLGVGFGEPYRPLGFPYVREHRLLSDPIAVNVTSNHHSLFDVALRLGVPAALVLAWGVFAPIIRSRNPAGPVLAIVVAVGLSFNAWLENQHMLAGLVLLTVLLARSDDRHGLRGAP